MKLTHEDIKKILPALFTLLLSILSVLFLLRYENAFQENLLRLLMENQASLENAKTRFIKSGEEKIIIEQNLPKYQKLFNQGAIGEEKRIEWMDALRNIHQENKLFNIKFMIGEQSSYSNPNQGIEPFKPYHSLMQIEWALLHEGDLLVLLDAMKQKSLAPFVVRQCEITRQNNNINNSITANLQAKCELDWVTVHEPLSAVKANDKDVN